MMMNNWNDIRITHNDHVHKKTEDTSGNDTGGFLGLLGLIANVCLVLLIIHSRDRHFPRRRPPSYAQVSGHWSSDIQISVTTFVDSGSRIICLELNHLFRVVPRWFMPWCACFVSANRDHPTDEPETQRENMENILPIRFSGAVLNADILQSYFDLDCTTALVHIKGSICLDLNSCYFPKNVIKFSEPLARFDHWINK